MSNYLNYYNNSYDACRWAFINRMSSSSFSMKSVPAGNCGDLFTDIAYLKNGPENPLVIICSGLHGIEGYVGSAMQLYLPELLWQPQFGKLDFLLIHAVNPWGFRHNRRVTSNNVDLNRNFSMSPGLFNLANTGYSALYKCLEPGKPYTGNVWNSVSSFSSLLYHVLKNSRASLIQAIGQGQYEYDKGIIFGGKSFEPETASISRVMEAYCKPYSKILVIDIHTGLGTKGRLQLLHAPKIPENTKSMVNKLFNNQMIPCSNENFFRENGSFLDFVWQINQPKLCLPVMFEFGTANSQHLKGAFHTLNTMIIENQIHFYGCTNPTARNIIANRFLELFYPSCKSWRVSAMSQFSNILQMALNNYLKL